ncbi:MAG: response regulator [Moraxellaceae bacterium]|nr:MAG: response regulator [Moraxellaceae bacterium]
MNRKLKRFTVLTATQVKQKVLVIEDNIDGAESLWSALDLLGYDARVAHNGADGLQLAEDFRPDAILLDVGLPDMGGYQVAQQLRATSWGKDIYLIAATGWSQFEVKEVAFKAGCDFHIVKPIDLMELDGIMKGL